MTTAEIFSGRLIMAPMTRGTDLPFRRLLVEQGAEVILGEMAYAHKIVREDKRELALLRRHPEEKIFGVQLAGKHPEVVAEAARIAVDRGADFIDLNLGCPIDDATRRGFGAALLERTSRVGEIVSAVKRRIQVPLTLKLRLGWSDGKPTFLKIARVAEDSGADAIALHGRSRAQRYRRPADWQSVAALVEEVRVPVIGNGDIFGWRDAVRRREESGCAAVMIGRWALAKPWIFREFIEQRDLAPSIEQRLALIRRYVDLCREHFGEDDRGRERTRQFLVFHQDFFRRHRSAPSSEAVNSDDPGDWGQPEADELGAWLARGDIDAAEALCRWLVDGGPCVPPPATDGESPRAVATRAFG